MATALSEAGTKFIGRNEGFEAKAYKDSGGVITIGYGFTWGSKVFRDYWQKAHGRSLRMGDVITQVESLSLLRKLANDEYGLAADKALPDSIDQTKFDAATDYLYNCGSGAVKDRWFKALATGQDAQAAQLIRSSRITAGGRRLSGLINRRTAEAKLILNGDYGPGITPDTIITGPQPKPIPKPASTEGIKWTQEQLQTLGLYKGNIDGVPGPLTDGAIRNFQRQHPELTVDGVVGPATRAALIRAVDAKIAARAGATAGAVGVGAGGAAATSTAHVTPVSPEVPVTPEQVAAMPWHTIEWLIGLGLVGLIIVLTAFLVWRNRGVIFRFRTPT